MSLLFFSPEYHWQSWLFQCLSNPRSFFSNQQNCKLYLNHIEQHHFNITPSTRNQWYSIHPQKLFQPSSILFGSIAKEFLSHYNGSLKEAIQAIYNDIKWRPDQFVESTDQNDDLPLDLNSNSNNDSEYYWTNRTIQKKYLEILARELNITRLEQWYKVKREPLIRDKIEMKKMLSYYRYSLAELLMNAYPNYNWLPWLFSEYRVAGNSNSIVNTLWENVTYQRTFAEEMTRKLLNKNNNSTSSNSSSISSLQANWYSQNRTALINQNQYWNSIFSFTEQQTHLGVGFQLFDFIERVYPEYKWIPWLFEEFTQVSIHIINAN